MFPNDGLAGRQMETADVVVREAKGGTCRGDRRSPSITTKPNTARPISALRPPCRPRARGFELTVAANTRVGPLRARILARNWADPGAGSSAS